MRMAATYWLIKSDVAAYAWSQLVEEGATEWTGVRNFEARNHLQAMKPGDLALFYHSGEDKAVVGVARVVREAKPDPTADDPAWVSVEVEPVAPMRDPVTLSAIKADPSLAQMQLVRRSRLSVTPVTAAEFERVLALGGTKLPSGKRAKRRQAP